MKSILILGARLNQLAAIVTAQRLGLRAIAVDPDQHAIGFDVADEGVVCDLADMQECCRIAKRFRVDGVLTIAADFPVPTVAYLCEQLRFPGVRPAVARRATNKYAMRQALHAAGVLCPEWAHVTDVSAACAVIKRFAKPVILKPALSNGSQGVSRLPQDATKNRIDEAFQRAMRFTRSDGVMIEKFINGPEVSVEAFTIDGVTHVLAVTDKSTSDLHCVEIGHSQPSQLATRDLANIHSTAVAAVNALGIDGSASHTEIRMGAEGPYVIEIAARLGGGFINSHLVPLSCGVDMVEAAIRVALGEQPDLRPTCDRGAAIRFLLPQPGIVRCIRGVEECRKSASVRQLEIYVREGDQIEPLIDNSVRAGHVICDAENVSRAIELAHQAVESISIETEPVTASIISGTPS